MNRDEFDSLQLQALLDQGAAGASSAYEVLLRQVADRLLRLTRKMFRAYPHLRRWEQTDDIFQTAAMRLHRSLANVRPSTVAAFWGLAATQIRRSLIDLARHHFGPEGAAAHHESAVREPPSGTRLKQDPREAEASEGGPESLAEWTEFHSLVDQLPSDEKEVFHLTWYAGLPQKEVARLLGVSLPTVQRRWYAAKIRLGDWTRGERNAAASEKPA